MELKESDFTDLRIPTYVLFSCDLTATQKLLYAIVYNFRDGQGYLDLSKDLLKKIMKLPYLKIVDQFNVLHRLCYIVVEGDHSRKLRIRLYLDRMEKLCSLE